MAVVYWIHTKDHTDIAQHGYVGISKTSAKDRFRSHRSSATRGSSLTIHRAINKHGKDIVVDTLIEGPEDYCLLIEQRLRPLPEIGWNICAGGKATRSGRKHSGSTRDAMSAKRKAAGLSQQRIESMRVARTYEHRALQKDWNNPKSKAEVWMDADALYVAFKAFDKCGHKRLATVCRFTGNNLETITAKFNMGWKPHEDSEYQMWKAGQLKATNG